MKNPIRLSVGDGGEAGSQFLNRNVDLYLVRAQKHRESNYRYRQIKRAQLSQLYFTLQSLFLVEYMRNEERIPVGFNWKSKDELFHEDLKKSITSQKEKDDNSFPKIKSDGVGLTINSSNIVKILGTLSESSKTVKKLTPILMRHEHAWKKMMTKGCAECGKEIEEACPNDKLTELKDTDPVHYSFLGAKISRLNLKKPENEAEHNKMMNGVLLKYYTKAGITGKLPGGVKELFAVGENELKVPFACKERYDMQTSSWNDAIVGSFFPLSRRKEEPKTTGARLYFGSTAPPSLLVQNLMADAIKRILARKLVEGGKRMGIDIKLEYHPRKDRLLWEYIASCKNGTVQTKLIDVEYESGTEFHSLSILEFGKGVIHQPAAEGFRGEMTHCLQPGGEKWGWNDSSERKLPIVSPNVTLAEINSIFTLNKEVKGVVICIDHWEIDGDDEEWNYSEEGDKYWGVGPYLFHNDEPKKGARTFVTFLKRIIDKSKYGIKREDVMHTRRAYGVLQKKDLNNFLKSE